MINDKLKWNETVDEVIEFHGHYAKGEHIRRWRGDWYVKFDGEWCFCEKEQIKKEIREYLDVCRCLSNKPVTKQDVSEMYAELKAYPDILIPPVCHLEPLATDNPKRANPKWLYYTPANPEERIGYPAA